MNSDLLYRQISAAARGSEAVRDIVKRLAEFKRRNKTAVRNIKTIGMFFWGIRGDGTGRVISMLSKLWTGMGYSVILMTEEEPTQNDYQIPDGVKRVVVPKLERNAASKEIMARVDAVMNCVRENAIDLFIDNAFNSDYLVWNILAACCAGALTAVYVHSFSLRFFLNIDDMTRQRFEWYAACDLAIVLSRTDKRFLEHMGINAEFIPNPCDLAPIKRNRGSNGNKFLWIGRLAREKKVLQAIEAFRIIKKRIPGATLTIAGTGYLSNEVAEYVGKSGIGGITLAGFVNSVSEYYLDSDLLLFTSEYEGWPLAVNEALACGLPIVMYDLPYLEQVRDGRGIITVAQDDIGALAEQSIRLLNDSEEWYKLSLEASNNFADYIAFDWERAWRDTFFRLSRYERANPFLNINDDDSALIKLLLRFHSIGMERAYGELKELRSCAAIKTSRTYRVGKAVMWLPKAIRKAFRRK